MSDREFPELPNRWQGQNLTQALTQIDPNQIARQHLQDCQAEIHDYWDESDQFYATVRFKQLPTPQLISSSLGITPDHPKTAHWLKLRYLLTISSDAIVGELFLILNDNLEVIDENWIINVSSPHVVATLETF